MKDIYTINTMKQRGIQRWPRLVLRTAAAYAENKNTEKYMDPSGLNTDIYRNF